MFYTLKTWALKVVNICWGPMCYLNMEMLTETKVGGRRLMQPATA